MDHNNLLVAGLASGKLLDMLQDSFMTVCIAGMVKLTYVVWHLFGLLIAIDFTLAFILNLENGDHLQTIIKKFLKYGLWAFFIAHWGTIVDLVVTSFVKVGAIAGGVTDDKIAGPLVRSPAFICIMGLRIAAPFLTHPSAAPSGQLDMAVASLLGHEGTLSLFAGLAIALSFWSIAVQMFITYVEFYIVATLTFIMIPFGGNEHTKPWADKAISCIISFGVKLMVLTFLICIMEPIMESWSLKPLMVNGSIPWDQSLYTAMACMTMSFLIWQAPSLAASIVSGASSGGLTQGGLGGATGMGMGMGATGMGMGGTGMGMGGIGGGMRSAVGANGLGNQLTKAVASAAGDAVRLMSAMTGSSTGQSGIGSNVSGGLGGGPNLGKSGAANMPAGTGQGQQPNSKPQSSLGGTGTNTGTGTGKSDNQQLANASKTAAVNASKPAANANASGGTVPGQPAGVSSGSRGADTGRSTPNGPGGYGTPPPPTGGSGGGSGSGGSSGSSVIQTDNHIPPSPIPTPTDTNPLISTAGSLPLDASFSSPGTNPPGNNWPDPKKND